MQLLPIEFAIKAVLIAVGTAGVLRILNVKTAAARHAAWAGVVVAMLLLPVWTIWGPKVAMHLLPPVPERSATHAIATAEALEPAIGSPGVGHSEESTLIPRHRGWNWTASLLVIYLVGVAMFLVRLALGTLQAELLVRRAFHRDGKLFSGACGASVTVGWLRPVVVLPESWSQWPAAQLDAVLTHENEHARRRDPLFQWLALLNRAVFWFHPLAWWLERRIAALAEEACDAVVLARGHDPRDYSKYLVDMARSVASSGARIQIWGMAMPGGFLEERIRRILEGGPLPRLSRSRLVCACVGCALTSTVLATSTLDHQRGARQPDQKVVLAHGNPTVPDSALQNPMLARRQQQAATGLSSAGMLNGNPASRILEVDLPRPEVLRLLSIRGLSPSAREDLQTQLQFQVGQTIDNAAVQRARDVLRQFDDNLRLAWVWCNIGTTATGVCLMIYPPDGGSVRPEHAPDSTSGSALSDVPRRLHVDIQGLSPEATADLRRRLALQEGETLDHAAFVKELERIHQIISEFDPHLNDSQMLGKSQRKVGADGKVLPPDSMDVTLIISLRDSAPQPAGLEQYAKVARAPSLENVPIKLHVDIQGLSPEATSELRQRLAVREGEATDSEGLKKTVERIHQIISEFDPRLMDEMHFGVLSRKFGADGKPIPWDNAEATIVIRHVDAVPNVGPAVR